MLDTITASPARTHATRSLVDRDEYGPVGDRAGGLFTAPIEPQALRIERDEHARRLGTWVPDGFLL